MGRKKNRKQFIANEKQQKVDPLHDDMKLREATIELQLENSLGGALGFNEGFPQNQGTGWSEQISNVTTIFKNLRWYLVSNFRQVLCEIYVELGLVATIVDVPVDDALRGGVTIRTKQLSEEQIKQIQITMDREADLTHVGQAGKWNRLFGGGGVLIMTDQDPMEPLDLNNISKDTPLEFRAVDMWELYWDLQNTEGYDPTVQMEDFEYYSYYGIQVHKSRVMVLKGLTAPSFIRPRLRGWGFSVVEKLVRSINQYLKATDLGFEVLDEFKLDVFKLKNLSDTLLAPNGEEQVKKRVALTNWLKNYQNAVVMDSEDDFDHKQLSFAGLAEAMQGIRMQVASDMRMPLTKIFGISAAGFNSGEDDIEVYNAMVESEVREKIKFVILRLIEIRCQKLFNFIPDDIEIEFKPLRMMTAEQEENVKTAKFNRLLSAIQANQINTFEFREGCNKDNLLPITLDVKSDMLNLSGSEDDAVTDDGAEDDSDDIDGEGGANKPDTQKGVAPGSKAKSPDAKDPKDPPSQKNVNSLAYEVAAYEASGGDTRHALSEVQKVLVKNPGKVDESLWKKAKAASIQAFQTIKWPFVSWYYKRMGGTFQ